MQYFSNLSTTISANGSPEQRHFVSAPAVEPHSPLTKTATDLAASQRAAISRAYSELLVGGRHFSC